MLFDYTTLQVIWWILIGVLLIGFALTNGMDMAVSALLFPVGKNSAERKVLISTIVPHWDGNQVWLITAGGAIFAAWPEVYAASFSGLYWAMLLVLFAIWLRPLAFDYRNHGETEIWKKRWDIALSVGSLIPMLIFGVAFGNLLQGLPFYADENMRWHYDGYFLSALLPLLNPFALLCGVISVLMLITHGCMWIMLRVDESISLRARKIAVISALLTVVLFVVFLKLYSSRIFLLKLFICELFTALPAFPNKISKNKRYFSSGLGDFISLICLRESIVALSKPSIKV